jgi:hypothetical protein
MTETFNCGFFFSFALVMFEKGLNYMKLENNICLSKFQMYPGYVPKEDNDPNCQILDQRLLPYAGSDFHVSCGQWSGLVIGMSYSFFFLSNFC